MSRVIEDVACTVCSCVCDDLRLTVDDDRIVRAEGACRLAEPWFAGQHDHAPSAARIDGQACEIDEAIERAASILAAAKSPLIYGLAGSSTPGQRAAVELADGLGAAIDTTASASHESAVMAVQQAGLSTCTLGEVRNRADLVIYWGSNPVETHPRHPQRYSLDPKGQFIPGGRAGRTLVVVDVRPTATSRLSDQFLQVEPGRDFEVLAALRTLVRGVELTSDSAWGAPQEDLARLAERMKSCRYGIVFFGGGLAQNGQGHRTVEALVRLVRELNDHTRFHARRMPGRGEAAGADGVLGWQTGYPCAVDFSRGYPRYGPGEYSADVLLRRGEVDACLLIGSDAAGSLSPAAREVLGQIPRIAIDSAAAESALPASVRFTAAVYGIHLPGTAYRMDDVPIPLKAILPTEYPSDESILSQIQSRLADPS